MVQIVPTVTAEVTPAEPVQITQRILASLAKDLAIGLEPDEAIIARHGLTKVDYENLKLNEFFTKLVDCARIEWHSAANTATRLALEAAFTAEQILPEITVRAKSGDEPLNHVVDFMKWLTDVGGLKQDPKKGAGQERFQIVINLGADTKLEYSGSRQPLEGPDLLPAPEDDKEDRV